MSQHPHIVIFNPDQWRSDVIGCHGNPAAITPNIDRIAKEDGVSFRNAYCQNTVCTPSRCSFMTGWYPHVRGHRTMFHMLHNEEGDPNLLRVLRKEGYKVWWGGKNDLIPGQSSFDEVCDVKFRASPEDLKRWGVIEQENNHGGNLAWRGLPDSDTFYSFYKGKLDKGEQPFYGDSDWFNVMGAIDLIHNHTGDEPLCIYLPLGYPHPPYCVEEPYYSAIQRDLIPERPIAKGGLSTKASILSAIAEGQNLKTWSDERWRELRATYYAMCMRVDHQLGLVLDALKKKGLYDDTALFLFSDHGDYTGDYGVVEKTQNTFEDALSNVPFVVKPPKSVGVKPRVCDALVELVDFSATVYDLLQIDPGYDSFGKSLIPVLKGETDEHRDAAFCEGGRRMGETQAMERESKQTDNPNGLYYPRVRLQGSDEQPWHSKAAMCRMGQLKYIRRHYERDELYDLAVDPHECNNIIDEPQYGEQLFTLKERLLTWYMETCDVVPRNTDKR